MQNRLRAWRTRMNLTQQQAADELGVSLSTIKQYEGTNFRVPPVPIQRLCRALELLKAGADCDQMAVRKTVSIAAH